MSSPSTPNLLDDVFGDLLVIAFRPSDAIHLHRGILSLPVMNDDLDHLRHLLNEYTGLEERAC